MSMKKTLQGLTAAVALLVAVPALAEVKVALDSPPSLEQSGTYVWAHTFAEYLNSHGMEAVEFERGALGGEAEKLDQVSQGLLEVSMSDTKSAGSLDATMFGVMLPYFFKDGDELDKALFTGGMLDRINSGTRPKGVLVADVVHLGLPAGIFTTDKAVTSVADMADIRMRALDEIQIAIFKAWGSQGTIVSWDEVPNALQTGVADGYLNPPFVPLLFGHTGFIKHFTDAAIVPSTRVALLSEDWYQGLSDAERQTVDEAIVAARTANRDWLAARGGILSKLEEAGVAVVRMDDAAREEFRAASVPLYGAIPMPDGALEAWSKAIGR